MPEDISVVGYDGSQLSRLAPRELTTVRQDADAMARLSVTRAVSLLRGVTEGDQNVVLLPTMVRGETTGPRLHVVPSGPHHVPRERVV
jgi:LacI family transcriptional regulator